MWLGLLFFGVIKNGSIYLLFISVRYKSIQLVSLFTLDSGLKISYIIIIIITIIITNFESSK